jgi:hypothetical protein
MEKNFVLEAPPPEEEYRAIIPMVLTSALDK